MDDEQIAETVGATIRRLREARGWSMAELGERVGLSRQNVWRTETGSTTPTLATVIAYATAFGMTLPGFLRDLEAARKEAVG